MPRSIEEITQGKTTQDLRAEAIYYVQKHNFAFVQQGLELQPGKIRSHGRKSDCIEFISRCETELEQRLTVEPIVEPVVEKIVEPIVEQTVEQTVEPIVEQTVEPIVEPVVEQTVELDRDSEYQNSEKERLHIAKVLYTSTYKNDEFVGLREYFFNLCKSGKFFTPDFAILVAQTRVIIERYADSVSKSGKAHPGSIQAIKVAIMKLIREMAIQDNDKFEHPDDEITLISTYETYEDAIRGAFRDIGAKKHQLNTAMNRAGEIDVRAIQAKPFIDWAVSQVSNLPESPARWKEVAIACMLLSGRRQSEVMSSGLFTPIDDHNVIFEGQLKRHDGELVEAVKIPVLGKSGENLIKAIQWLQDNDKRTLPSERTVKGIQSAAAKSHSRCSRYIASTMKELQQYCPITNDKEWESTDGDNKFKGHITRQIYAQICEGLFNDPNERKKRAFINEILLESRDASVPYDRDVNIVDIQEIKERYGSIEE